MDLRSESNRAMASASKNFAASNIALIAEPLPGIPRYIATISSWLSDVISTDFATSRVSSVEPPSDMNIKAVLL